MIHKSMPEHDYATHSAPSSHSSSPGAPASGGKCCSWARAMGPPPAAKWLAPEKVGQSRWAQQSNLSMERTPARLHNFEIPNEEVPETSPPEGTQVQDMMSSLPVSPSIPSSGPHALTTLPDGQDEEAKQNLVACEQSSPPPRETCCTEEAQSGSPAVESTPEDKCSPQVKSQSSIFRISHLAITSFESLSKSNVPEECPEPRLRLHYVPISSSSLMDFIQMSKDLTREAKYAAMTDNRYIRALRHHRAALEKTSLSTRDQPTASVEQQLSTHRDSVSSLSPLPLSGETPQAGVGLMQEFFVPCSCLASDNALCLMREAGGEAIVFPPTYDKDFAESPFEKEEKTQYDSLDGKTPRGSLDEAWVQCNHEHSQSENFPSTGRNGPADLRGTQISQSDTSGNLSERTPSRRIRV